MLQKDSIQSHLLPLMKQAAQLKAALWGGPCGEEQRAAQEDLNPANDHVSELRSRAFPS